MDKKAKIQGIIRLFPDIVEVVIRTNGGDLTINDTNAASHQYHYGIANSATISTGTSCYECHAIIGSITLNAGKATAGEDSAINRIVLNNSSVFDASDADFIGQVYAASAAQVTGVETKSLTVIAPVDTEESYAVSDGATLKAILEGGTTVDSKYVDSNGFSNIHLASDMAFVDNGYTARRGVINMNNASVKVNLDLNGKKISWNLTSGTDEAALIYMNGGTLVIDDSQGTGEINVTNTRSGGLSALMYGINGNFTLNNGTLSIESTKVNSYQGVLMYYGTEDSYSMNITINGGSVLGKNKLYDDAIITTFGGASVITINGGYLYGRTGILAMTDGTLNKRELNLTINDGSIMSYQCPIRFCIFQDAYSANVTLKGGQYNFSGDDSLRPGKKYDNTITITNCTGTSIDTLWSQINVTDQR